MIEIEIHPFPPFVPNNANVLIVGSFPGKQTKNKEEGDQWFYGAKKNQFWSILSSVYEIELKTTEAKKRLFQTKGIAITDILLRVRRKDGGHLDANLEIIEFNEKAIKSILEENKFKSIFFTSKFVEKHFLKLFPETANTECLPSPSPMYFRKSKEEKIKFYKSKLPE